MVLASALEPLRAASGLPNGPVINWDICTIDGAPVTSSSGLTITPQASLPDTVTKTDIDYLVMVSGYGMRDHTTPKIRARLQNAA